MTFKNKSIYLEGVTRRQAAATLTLSQNSNSFSATKLIDKTQSKPRFSPVGDMSNRFLCVTLSHCRVQVEAASDLLH